MGNAEENNLGAAAQVLSYLALSSSFATFTNASFDVNFLAEQSTLATENAHEETNDSAHRSDQQNQQMPLAI